MAKKRNKKNSGSGSAPMELSTEIPKDLPQPMDTTEGKPSNPALNVIKRNRKMKGGIPVKRSKNLRKQKAMEKAISISEKSEEKILRNKSRVSRIQSAKSLYD